MLKWYLIGAILLLMLAIGFIDFCIKKGWGCNNPAFGSLLLEKVKKIISVVMAIMLIVVTILLLVEDIWRMSI